MVYTLTERLQRLGVEKSLGAELSRQIAGGAASTLRLQSVGMPTTQAVLITKGIAAGTIKAAKLVAAGMPPEVAKVVAERVAQPPINTVAPVASGTAKVGQVLSVTNGTWTSPSGTPTYTYRWFRGGTAPLGTSATYTCVAADVGYNITCQVTATNVNGSRAAASNMLGPVVA